MTKAIAPMLDSTLRRARGVQGGRPPAEAERLPNG